jgi:hypothetical protein
MSMQTPMLLVAAAIAFQTADKPAVLEAGGAKVTMPGPHRQRDQKVPTAMGDMDQHIYGAVLGDAIFAYSYSDFPAAASRVDPDRIVDGAITGSIARMQGKLLSTREVKAGKISGNEYEHTVVYPGGKAGLGRSRMYLVGLRMYSVAVMGPKEDVRSKAADDFLNSFELIKPPAAKGPVSFAEAGFKVAMPGDPKLDEVRESTDVGVIDSRIYTSE